MIIALKDEFTISGCEFKFHLLNGSSSILSLHLGEQFHSRVIIIGLEDDLYVGNPLVDIYMKCSCSTSNAVKALRGIVSPNVISWTSLIAGFAENGLEEESFQLFAEMQATGVQPNSFTLSTILGACSKMRSVAPTMMLHGHIIKAKADIDIAVGNALVDAYAGGGMTDEAWSVIGMMKHRDPITYTCLSARLNQKGDHGMALQVFIHMCNDGIKMDEFSLASFLSAAAGLGTMEAGKQLHCYSFKSGFQRNNSVSNSLSLISACSHGGLLDLGLQYFYSMEKVYHITPRLDHFVCLVDLLVEVAA